MVSRGYRKRGCGVVLVKHVKNPILLAREMLVRGETDGGGGDNGGEGDPSGGSGGAQGHCVLGGPTVEQLAKEWGLAMVAEEYFFTKRRWDEHKRGLRETDARSMLLSELGWKERMYARAQRSFDQRPGDQQPEPWEKATSRDTDGWDGHEYLPQGTVGCCVLDQYGTLCVATSTGGLTNKLSGRIGDTPTLGAGFWAEEWEEPRPKIYRQPHQQSPLIAVIPRGLRQAISECLPGLSGYTEIPPMPSENEKSGSTTTRAVAMSGTGNGDSFLRTAAVRTAAAIARFAPQRSLASAVREMAGPSGELQRSAGDRWHKTGEGEGGIIGIELVNGVGKIVYDFNCGGMFRSWVDEDGKERVMVFKDDYHT